MKWKRSRKAKDQVIQAEAEKQRGADKASGKLLPGEVGGQEDEEEMSDEEPKRHSAGKQLLHPTADTFSYSSEEEEEDTQSAAHREMNLLL